jgi:uncharacterized protein
MNRITITAGNVMMEAELNETSTARKVWDALPIEARANLWGDEIYFEIPVSAVEEPDARADVAVGELGYWPVGSAFCVFFGPTPVSSGVEPRAYSPVNILGRVLGDATRFRGVRPGAAVRLARAEVAA